MSNVPWWWRFREAADDATSKPWFNYAVIVVGVLVAILCVGGFVAVVKQTNSPDYDPPRNAYYLGGVR